MTDPFAPFVQALRSDLRGPLPGRTAQLRMAPAMRSGRYKETPGPDVRRGGVLALFYPAEGQIWLPLILRPTYTGVHSGQVGFPGGGREPGDADLTATALREAWEEVGVTPAEVTVLGKLSPLFVFASNYLVEPTVGWTPVRPSFNPDPYEVARLLETPLATLLDPATVHREPWNLRGTVVEVPYFSVQGQTVWGATAMMLAELLALPSMALAATHGRA
jgi:8-oxo-dGTP pyrophosphatase MutT (NUDIX family)